MKRQRVDAKSEKSERMGWSPAGRLLAIVLALWALAMIVPGLQRVFDSLDSFGLTVNNDGVVTDVVSPFLSPSDSPAAVSGIVPGDRIDLKAMRCIPFGTPQCANLVTILGGLGGLQAVLPGREVTLTLLPASGRHSRSVTLHSVPSPLEWGERVVLFADTAVGVAVILIAFWLVWTRPSRMTWGLFLYVIWINPGQSYTYYAVVQQWPLAVFAQELAECLAQGAAFAGLVIFALRFPNDRTEQRWEKVQRAAPLLAVAIALLALLAFGSTFGFHTEGVTDASLLAGYGVDAAVLLILLNRRRELPPQEDQRVRWVIWGCVIGLPTYIFAELCQTGDLVPRLLGFVPSNAWVGLLFLPNGVLAYFASQAVWQHRVISVSIPLRHGTILVALSFALGIPVFQLHEKLNSLQETFRPAPWIWPLLVAPIILLLLGRLHEWAVEIVDRLFNRKFHAARRKIERATEEMGKAEDLREIDRLMVDSAVDALSLSSGTIFRLEGGVFRRTHDLKGWTALMTRELRPETDAIVLRSLEVGAPVRLGPDGWRSDGLPSGLEAPSLAVPVRSGVPEATAVALFGPHQTGNDIDDDEREMLDQFALHAATGYERVVATMLRKEVAQLRAQLASIKARDRMEPAGS
jgi:hypothetical protein